jgi:hypothetical protein
VRCKDPSVTWKTNSRSGNRLLDALADCQYPQSLFSAPFNNTYGINVEIVGMDLWAGGELGCVAARDQAMT